MPEINLKRGWSRVCKVLTILWSAYVLVGYPLEQQARAEKTEKTVFLDCWHANQDFKACSDYARLQANSSQSLLRVFGIGNLASQFVVIETISGFEDVVGIQRRTH